MTPPVPVSGNQGEVASFRQSTIYKLVMTPIIFLSFIVSLSLVDFRHSAKRARYHAEPEPSRLPRWLHRIIYRYQRYQYVPVDDKGRLMGEKAKGDLFYHSKQRKLMKMEVVEAFEIRSTILVILAVAGLCALWGLWRIASWALSTFGLQW